MDLICYNLLYSFMLWYTPVAVLRKGPGGGGGGGGGGGLGLGVRVRVRVTHL